MAISGPPAHCPVVHRHTPGLYIRETHIPKGTLVTSMVHKKEHPFIVSKGRIEVGSLNEGFVVYEAPHCGVTLPGTRRILHALEDTIWTTFHVTNETDVEKIAAEILDQSPNVFIDGADPLLNQWKIHLANIEEVES